MNFYDVKHIIKKNKSTNLKYLNVQIKYVEQDHGQTNKIKKYVL